MRSENEPKLPTARPKAAQIPFMNEIVYFLTDLNLKSSNHMPNLLRWFFNKRKKGKWRSSRRRRRRPHLSHLKLGQWSELRGRAREWSIPKSLSIAVCHNQQPNAVVVCTMYSTVIQRFSVLWIDRQTLEHLFYIQKLYPVSMSIDGQLNELSFFDVSN